MTSRDEETVRPEPSSEESTRTRLGAVRTLLAAAVDSLTGRYELRGRLGKGGMGEVLDAHDTRLNREVAVKVLRVAHPDDEDVRRFVREAQLTSRLDHPHVPPVHDLGVGPDGALYFTMKRLRGRTLAEIARTGDLRRHARIDVFLKVCDAVAYAHSRGVLHRDIKPSNVIVGEFREVYLLDWGLAKHVTDDEATSENAPLSEPTDEVLTLTDPSGDGDDDLTTGGSVLGTPGFLSPEQARGEKDAVDARSDVFSLGVLLYVLLCGATPFPGRGRVAIEAVRSGVFVPPRRAKGDVPWELERVVLRAMAHAPDHRYPTVLELRDDVVAFREGQPLATVHYSPAQRIAKWAVRHRLALVIGAAGSLAATLSALLVVVVYLVSVSSARDRALEAEHVAQVALADNQVTLSRAEMELGRIDSAVALLDDAAAVYARLEVNDRKVTAARSAIAQTHPPPELSWARAGRSLQMGALSDDADRAALIFGDAHVTVFGIPSGEILSRTPLPPVRAAFLNLVFLEDRAVALMIVEDALRLWDAEAQTWITPPIPLPRSEITPRAWVVDQGRVVVVSGPSLGTRAYRLPDGEPIGTPRPDLLVDAVGRDTPRVFGHVAPNSLHRSAEVSVFWDVVSGEELLREPLASLGAVSDDGRTLVHTVDGVMVCSSADGRVRYWSADLPINGYLAFVDGGTSLALVGSDQHLFLIDAATGRITSERRTAGGPTSSHGRIMPSRRGQRLLVGSTDTASVWAFGAGAQASVTRTSDSSLTAVALSPDGLIAATTGWDGVLRVWDWRSRQLLRSIPTCASGSRDVAFGDDGDEVLVADRDGAAQLVDLITGTIEREHRIPDATLAMGVAMREGEHIVAFEFGQIVAFSDDQGDDAERWRIVGQIQSPWAIALSPDRRRLLVTGRARHQPSFELWDLDTRTLLVTGPKETAGYRASFSEDGERIAIGTHEGTLLIHEVASGDLDVRRLRHEALQSVAWSPDGSMVVAGAYDGQVDVLDGTTFQPLTSQRLHKRSLTEVAFVPGDTAFLTASGDGAWGLVDTTRWQRLGSVTEPIDPEIGRPRADAARWRELAAAAMWSGNWDHVLAYLDRAEAEGAAPQWEDRARAHWAAGDKDRARAALDNALAEQDLGSRRVWRAAP